MLSLTSTIVTFVIGAPPQEGYIAIHADPNGHGAQTIGAAASLGIDQTLEMTAAVSPSRNIDVGHPSMGKLETNDSSCGGQLFTTLSELPDNVKMRVPSFFMKSASSTPATCVFVVV